MALTHQRRHPVPPRDRARPGDGQAPVVRARRPGLGAGHVVVGDHRLAARAAATFGIKVYPIAIGTDEAQGAQAAAMETVLSQTARITGGQYFRASNVQALQEIYDEIDRLESVSEVMVAREQAIPLGLWLLLTGMALVAGATALRGSRWGLVP